MGNWIFTVTKGVQKFIDALSTGDKAKINSIFLLFEEYGPSLPSKYIKRMSGTKELWELRAKRVRVFFFINGNTGVGVHAIVKKSQKTPKSDIDTAIRRVRLLEEEDI